MLLLGRDADPTSPHIDRQSLSKNGLPILPPLDGLSILPPPFARVDHEDNEPPRRGVCFDESANQVQEFERVTEEEYDAVWYNREDMEYFRWERKQLASAIQQAQAQQEESDDSTTSWSQVMLYVYCAFRQYDNATDVGRALASTPPVEMDEYTIGMERCLLRPLARDFNVRREHLVTQMYQLQNCVYTTLEAKEIMLRDTSRLSSRAARLFAQYTAQVAYETKS